MGKQWKQWQTLFSWAPKITADGDCSHEMKRHLLLERKAMTNLDSILKSRDITLPTKIHLVKTMVLTIKKAEHQRIDAFELWCWRRLLRVPEPQGDPTSTKVGSLSLLQGIFPTQGSNPDLLQQIFPTQESNQGLLHCRQILYQLSSSGKPQIHGEAQFIFPTRFVPNIFP